MSGELLTTIAPANASTTPKKIVSHKSKKYQPFYLLSLCSHRQLSTAHPDRIKSIGQTWISRLPSTSRSTNKLAHPGRHHGGGEWAPLSPHKIRIDCVWRGLGIPEQRDRWFRANVTDDPSIHFTDGPDASPPSNSFKINWSATVATPVAKSFVALLHYLLAPMRFWPGRAPEFYWRSPSPRKPLSTQGGIIMKRTPSHLHSRILCL